MKGRNTLYRIKFKEAGKGRDGGDGPVKSFKTSASNPRAAGNKLRKPNCRIISIRPVHSG